MAKIDVGQNLSIDINGDVMTITVDLGKDFGPSSSGKTNVIASSMGSQVVTTNKGPVLVGININKKITAR